MKLVTTSKFFSKVAESWVYAVRLISGCFHHAISSYNAHAPTMLPWVFLHPTSCRKYDHTHQLTICCPTPFSTSNLYYSRSLADLCKEQVHMHSFDHTVAIIESDT